VSESERLAGIAIAAPDVRLAEGLKLDTDECGLLSRMRSGRGMLTRSAVADGIEGEDDFGPPDPAWAALQAWLMDHMGVAPVADAIDKWCGPDQFEGDILIGPVDAQWRASRRLPGIGSNRTLRLA
jgi:hypothetical protein